MTNHICSPFSVNLPVLPRDTEPDQANGREHAESDWQRLSRAHGTRDAACGQHGRGQQGELQSVRLAVRDAPSAARVEGADGAACGDGRHGAGAHVAHGAAAGGEAGKDVGDGAWRG